MRTKTITSVALLALTACFPVCAAPQHHSGYAGQQHRAITSLSPDDISELRRGGGWGLARAAELNGLPGPAHLLELKDDIALTPAQVTAIESLFQDMQRQAIAAGERLIGLEQRLDHAFKSRHITDRRLRALLSHIARIREELRYIHLSTHLKTPEILTAAQIDKYNILRGYRAPAHP
jgi:Spy/CpxP family protein refolding chaperone